MKRVYLTMLVVVTVAALSVSCDSPTAPAPPTAPTPSPPPAATLAGLVVSPLPSMAPVGSSHQLQATAYFSDGSTQAVQPAWSVTSGVAEISPSGMLTGRSAGSASITARYQSVEAHSAIFIVADFSGTWRGGWRRLECFGPRCGEGDFANPTVELLIAERGGLGPQSLGAIMSFGPWNQTRYVLSGSGSVSTGSTAFLSFQLVERGSAGERLREIVIQAGAASIDAAQTLSARASMMFREGAEMTRLEFELQNLRLISRSVRINPE